MSLRTLALAILLCTPLWNGCKKSRHYDGTCTSDGDCLDFQKCNSNICVRRDTAIKEKSYAASNPSFGRHKTTPRKMDPPVPQAAPADKGPAKPAPKLFEVPPPRRTGHPLKFRIDA